MPLDQFKGRIDRLIEEMKNAPKAPGCDTIFVPGEIEHNNWQRSLREGVELAPATYDRLAELAQNLEVPFPFKEYR